MPKIDPGVYTETRDESEYANLGGATIFGVVGTATKGEINKPILCYGEQDLVNKVGLPLTSLPDYAVQSAIQFLQRGQIVAFLRVESGLTPAVESSVTINDYPSDSSPTVDFEAISPGTWGDDLKVQILLEEDDEYSEVLGQGDGITTNFQSIPVANISSLTNFPVLPGTVQINAIVGSNVVVFTDDGLGNLAGPAVGDIGTVDYETGDLVVVFGGSGAPDNLTDITATYRSVQYNETFTATGGATVQWDETLAGNPVLSYENTNLIQPNTVYVMGSDGAGGMTTIGVDNGAGAITGTNIAAGTIDYVTGAISITLFPAAASQLVVCYRDPYFDVAIQALADRYGAVAEVEKFEDVVMDSNSERYIEDVINDGISGEIAKSAYVTATVPLVPSGYQPMSGLYDLAGGGDGTAGIADADYIGTYAGGSASGLQVMANPESVVIDLLAVPGVSSGSVVNAGLAVCADRKDAMFIVDPPFGLTTTDVANWHNGIGYSHAAFNNEYGILDWAWIKRYDAYNRMDVWLPPSGFAAAQMAYTDEVSYPWNAPAGRNRGVLRDAQEVEYSPTRAERIILYGHPNAINSIVDFQNTGIVIWGQKTLYRRNTARNRVNVMRMMCYIQRSVVSSCEYLTFEQNDAFLWARFKALVDPIFSSIKSSGGLEDYTIICDESTNPPAVRDQLEMHARVILVPLKTAEKIVIEFVLEGAGASV